MASAHARSSPCASELLERTARISANALARAADLDLHSAFPLTDLRAIADAGMLSAVLPQRLGGVALQDGESSGAFLLRVLHGLGGGNLAVGRLFEAHVNALRLVMRYGTAAQLQATAAEAQTGRLFALWVTDAADRPLRLVRDGDFIVLDGVKSFCSAAGHADFALVTATDDNQETRLLMLAQNAGESVLHRGLALQGLRAASTGEVDFTGCRVAADVLIGAAGDYLREPEFSTGAWRSSAVALGGLGELLSVARQQLVNRGRDSDPHQRARIGRAMIAHHTGWLWLEQAAKLSHDPAANPGTAVAYVNLARTAVETACLDAMQLIQRSLGLAAFIRGAPVERLCRDLGTYLRQPAPDAVLDEAAAYFMTRRLPSEGF